MTFGWAQLAYVQTLMRRRAAVRVEQSQLAMVEARLRQAALRNGFADLGELMARLPRDSCVADVVVEALLNHETSFFRNIHVFNSLREQVLPALIAARADKRRLRVWSAACSSGQEAYSLALLFSEIAELEGWRIDIVASDLSGTALARAQRGVYSQLEVQRGLPARLMVQRFEQTARGWQVGDDLRKMLDLRVINLARPLPVLPTFDLVFLRNVLMYFDIGDRERTLEAVASVTARDGYLALGAAETLLGITTRFSPRTLGGAVWYRPAGADADDGG